MATIYAHIPITHKPWQHDTEFSVVLSVYTRFALQNVL